MRTPRQLPIPPLRSRHGIWLAGLLLSIAVAAPSLAQTTVEDPIGEVQLFGEEEVLIKAATKTALPLSKVPGSATVITRRQIDASGARSIPELLRLVAGVSVRWNPMVQTIDIRGFGQNPFTSRVLLLIDGVPYNSWNKGGFPQHPGLDFFMLQSIKRIEVVRGPGSALYGENAYWGVINIVTLSGEDLRGGKVEVVVGDLDTQSFGALYGEKLAEGSIMVSARQLQSQLPMEFWFEEQDSQVNATDVFVKGVYKSLELSYYRHSDDMDGFSTPVGPGVFASSETIEQDIDIFAAKFDRSLRGDTVTIGADISYAQRSGMACSSCHAFPQNRALFSEKIDHGSQLIGDFRVGFRPVASHDVLVGVEARRVETGKGHEAELVDPATAGPEVFFDYTKVAAYFQDQISLADDRLRIVAGVRYDGSNDLFEDEVSPRLAFVYNPNEATVIRGGWSRAFRFPNFNELYLSGWFINSDNGRFAIPFSSFQPNPDLQPETVSTLDLGFEYRFNPSLSAKLDLYRSEVDDFIVLTFPQGGVRSENHPDGVSITGAELELRWNLKRGFTGFASWAYQDTDAGGRATSSIGTPLETVYAPENKLDLGFYFGPFRGLGGSLEVAWKDDSQGPSNWSPLINGTNELGLVESNTLLNVRLTYELPFGNTAAGRPLKLSLYGKDLLDERPQETYIPFDLRLPGRQVYAGLEWRF